MCSYVLIEQGGPAHHLTITITIAIIITTIITTITIIVNVQLRTY